MRLVENGANTCFLISRGSVLVGGAFAHIDDYICAIMWVGEIADAVDDAKPPFAFMKSFIEEVISTTMTNSHGKERVMAYFADKDVRSPMNAHFEYHLGSERHFYWDTRTRKTSGDMEISLLREISANQLTWFGKFKSFCFIMPDNDDYDAPASFLPLRMEVKAESDVAKLGSKAKLRKQIMLSRDAILFHEKVIDLCESKIDDVPEVAVSPAKKDLKKKSIDLRQVRRKEDDEDEDDDEDGDGEHDDDDEDDDDENGDSDGYPDDNDGDPERSDPPVSKSKPVKRKMMDEIEELKKQLARAMKKKKKNQEMYEDFYDEH